MGRATMAAEPPRSALAATTRTGKHRCDICRKVIFKKDSTPFAVNGRFRHRQCWPALWKTAKTIGFGGHDWGAALQALETERPHTALNAAQLQPVYNLIDREQMMKAVNCVSKGVRDSLLRNGGQIDRVSAALALANGA
jgi:hypothetical protein